MEMTKSRSNLALKLNFVQFLCLIGGKCHVVAIFIEAWGKVFLPAWGSKYARMGFAKVLGSHLGKNASGVGIGIGIWVESPIPPFIWVIHILFGFKNDPGVRGMVNLGEEGLCGHNKPIFIRT